jgi:3-deoxy-D-manno-octulosonic-acid transferase
LKFSAPTLPINDKDLSYIKSAIGNRPLWLAASSHPGEEEIFARVHKKLKLNYPNILTIIVPRHATRGNEILRSIKFSKGLNTLRSNNSPITSNTEIYIADTMGELGLFFRLSKIVFMGKSLVPLGGQNPLEALRLGCAIIHGPHMMNFQWISEQMMNYGCSLQVQNADQLTATITNLLSNPAKLEKMISKGSDFVNSQMQVVDLVAEEIKKLMDRENESA